MKLYKTTVNDTGWRKDGLGFFTQYGETRLVDGAPMVVVGNGVMVPADGWHSEYGDALLEAAQRIEVLGHRLLAQADRLRAEAAAKQGVTA